VICTVQAGSRNQEFHEIGAVIEQVSHLFKGVRFKHQVDTFWGRILVVCHSLKRTWDHELFVVFYCELTIQRTQKRTNYDSFNVFFGEPI
jgi:hypothetical protein